MKNLLSLIALSLALAGCEATVQTPDDPIIGGGPVVGPADANTATLCSWAHDAGMPFDAFGRAVVEQDIHTAYADSGNNSNGRLRIYLDCQGGNSALSWKLGDTRNDAWDTYQSSHEMSMGIGADDGTFTLSGNVNENRNGFACSESQGASGTSRLEDVERDGVDPNLVHLTVQITGTVTDNSNCGGDQTHAFSTAYRIDLHPSGDRFACASAMYDGNAQIIDRVCRGFYE